MIKKIAIVGATGMLGWPVTLALANSGFEVRALTRTLPTTLSHPKITWVKGDLKSKDDIQQLLTGEEAVHLNLSVKQTEKENDWHTEGEGLQNLLSVAKQSGIKQISYLSSLIMYYQGMNEFDWWVFKLKQDAVKAIKATAIPGSIFYPSTFMETIVHQYKAGPFLLVAGKSLHKQYFIAAEDYARQVVASYRNPEPTTQQDYIIQGEAGYTTDEALEIFRTNYQKGKLLKLNAPLGLIKFYGRFIQKMNYGYHILEALNKYPEKFEAENTWQKLGKPRITLEEFSKQA